MPSVTPENREDLKRMQFISCLPTIGTMVEMETGKNRPPAVYASYETTVSPYEQSYRAVVIPSSAHDKQRQKKIDKVFSQSFFLRRRSTDCCAQPCKGIFTAARTACRYYREGGSAQGVGRMFCSSRTRR